MSFKVDFIGIGTAKSASSTISKWLTEHPEVCLSEPRKTLYFNTYHAFWRKNRENWRIHKPLSWYKNHFNHCKNSQIKGEFAAIYFSDPDAPRRIFDHFPQVKLILCLRNPVDRAYSYYQMTKNYHKAEHRPFKQAIEEEREYIERGLYHKYLQRYLQYFDIKQIHILFFEDIKKDAQQEVEKLYRFLGVDSSYHPPSLRQKTNSAKRTKAKWLNRIEFKLVRFIGAMGGGHLIRWLKKKKVDFWVHSLYIKPYTYDALTSEDRIWLKAFFQEDIRALEELLDKDLSSWK